MLTLYTTPVIYLAFDRVGRSLGLITDTKPEPATEQEATQPGPPKPVTQES